MSKNRFRIFLVIALVLLMALGSTSLASAGKPTPTPPPTRPHPRWSRLACAPGCGLRITASAPCPASWWVSSIKSMAWRFPGATGARSWWWSRSTA